MGSRSRDGCYTCRIRKKKCDEQQPCCGSCRIHQLQCYGYEVPPPEWMQGKRGWKEIMATEQARQLQSIAEEQYKARRRHEKATKARATQTTKYTGVGDATISLGPRPAPGPEAIWWDGNFCTSLPDRNSHHNDARLAKLYVEFIFPIQFGFYPMATAADHSWLLSGMCGNKARYQGAMSVSACFRASLGESQKTDGIGLNAEVAERQATASRTLRAIITDFNQQTHGRGRRDVAALVLRILEIMHQLLSLEIFSMLEGSWQLHHQATRALLDALYAYRDSNTDEDLAQTAPSLSPVERAFGDLSCPDRQRSFEFHVACVVWIDIIANATFGSPLHTPRQFDYIPYLRGQGEGGMKSIRTQLIMGCDSTVMASIAEITQLADWKNLLQLESKVIDAAELCRRAGSIASRLRNQIRELEMQSRLDETKLEEESRLVTLQFACAAQAYLHVVVHGFDRLHSELGRLVEHNLRLLEGLPGGLLIRVNWPFTITGCLADRALHERYRGLVARLVAERRPLGMTWKGLMVIEECWRLRELRPNCDWQAAMKSLGKRVLLV